MQSFLRLKRLTNSAIGYLSSAAAHPLRIRNTRVAKRESVWETESVVSEIVSFVGPPPHAAKPSPRSNSLKSFMSLNKMFRRTARPLCTYKPEADVMKFMQFLQRNAQFTGPQHVHRLEITVYDEAVAASLHWLLGHGVAHLAIVPEVSDCHEKARALYGNRVDKQPIPRAGSKVQPRLITPRFVYTPRDSARSIPPEPSRVTSLTSICIDLTNFNLLSLRIVSDNKSSLRVKVLPPKSCRELIVRGLDADSVGELVLTPGLRTVDTTLCHLGPRGGCVLNLASSPLLEELKLTQMDLDRVVLSPKCRLRCLSLVGVRGACEALGMENYSDIDKVTISCCSTPINEIMKNLPSHIGNLQLISSTSDHWDMSGFQVSSLSIKDVALKSFVPPKGIRTLALNNSSLHGDSRNLLPMNIWGKMLRRDGTIEVLKLQNINDKKLSVRSATLIQLEVKDCELDCKAPPVVANFHCTSSRLSKWIGIFTACLNAVTVSSVLEPKFVLDLTETNLTHLHLDMCQLSGLVPPKVAPHELSINMI